MITDFISVISEWITGMFGWISTGVGSVVELFYTTGENAGFTFIGYLALFGLAIGLVSFVIAFVRGFVQK